ncbi:MAG: tRNA (N(6)-L-threonylcarbamoyladenosine(37)-C(2))-methylthiotransferase [Candidatus Pacearchaeota archaeon]
MNIYIETYGCSANQNNSEIIAGLLTRAGFIIVDNPNIADIYILNSCIVKGPTLQKMFSRISILKSKKLIVAGCMPDVFSKQILKIAPDASLVGSHNVNDIVNVAKSVMEGNQIFLISKQKEIHLCKPKNYRNRIIGITQISEGCLGDCSYCIVKLVKGNLNSYPESDILKNIQLDLQTGCKEIWITSQDCAAYGLDKLNNKENIVSLLKKILSIKSNFLVRLGMSNPNHIIPILQELIEIYKNKKMFKFLHIPLQSGSDRILKLMNRRYTSDDFRTIVNSFRAEIPDMTFSTDIIVGFPSETDEDFEKTLEIVKQTKPDIVNISRYWPMPKTYAAQLSGLKQGIIMKRTKELINLHNNISLELNKRKIGSILNVLVDEHKFDDVYIARTSDYKQVILKSDEKILGKFIDAKITGASNHYLIGELSK